MKKLFPVFVTLIVMFSACGVGAVQSVESKGGLIPPAPINVPFGGKIVTEINITDGDVLGIIKQAIPAFDKAVQDSVAGGTKSASDISTMLAKADVKGFMEAINGIKSVRIIVVKYSRKAPASSIIDELNKGIAKLGAFNKVMTDSNFSAPCAFALYAEPNNQGYIGYSYDSKKGLLYAGRVVGFVDVPKLTKWGWNLAQMFIPAMDFGNNLPVQTPETQQPSAPLQSQ